MLRHPLLQHGIIILDSAACLMCFLFFFIHASDFNYFLNFSSEGAYVVEEMSLLSQTAAALGFGVGKTSIECTLRAPRQGDSDLGGHRCSPGYICTSLYRLCMLQHVPVSSASLGNLIKRLNPHAVSLALPTSSPHWPPRRCLP